MDNNDIMIDKVYITLHIQLSFKDTVAQWHYQKAMQICIKMIALRYFQSLQRKRKKSSLTVIIQLPNFML